MDDPAVSKARDILHQLSADPDVRMLAEARELAQTTRRIEDGALREEGREEGREGELREAIVDICEVVGLDVGEPRLAQLDAMGTEALVALKRHAKAHRAWP